MKSYKVASQEGADYTQAEVGDTVDLELGKEQEQAILAAGWLEAPKKKKED